MKNVAFVVALAALALPVSAVRAGEDAIEKQYMEVGAARAKVELAFRTVQGFFQNPRDFRDWGRFDRIHDRMMQKLHQDQDAERAKPEMDKDQARIDALQTRIENMDRDWQTFQREHQALDTRYNQAEQGFHGIEQILNQIYATEHQWKDAHFDLQALLTLYETMATALKQANATGEAVVKDQADKYTEWKAKLAEVMAPPPAALPPAAPAADKPAGDKPVDAKPADGKGVF